MFGKEKVVTLRKYRPLFITVDGKVVEGKSTNWLITNRNTGSIKEFLTLGILENGFLSDDIGDIYIISNVIKITWEVIAERTIADTFREYQFWVKEEEIYCD